MLAFKITLFGLLYFFTLALGSKCPQDVISKLVVCYYKGETSLTNFNVCNCTHIVFMHAVRRTENNSIIATEDAKKYLEIIKEQKENLSAIFTLETKPDETSKILKSENKSEQLINGIVDFLQESLFDGVELNFNFDSNDGVSKESYATFMKTLSKTLSSHHRRVKRDGYDVIEKLQDDITTVAYTTQTPKNSTSKTQSIKIKNRKSKENSRKIREKKENYENDADYLTLEEAINVKFSEEKSDKRNTLKDVEEDLFKEKNFLIFVTLSTKPEIIAKKFDLKILSRYANILTVPTHHIVNDNEEHLTYHPSRLMGLSDIFNTDSILDFLTGMGAQKSKMVITLPATVLKFQLVNESKNTPRSPSTSKPHVIDQSQLCALFSKNNWTVERDEDLTAPYAFSKKTWLAFEDKISVNIKGKYILLRNLAGGAIYPIDSDLNDDDCSNQTGSGGYLTGILHKNFENLERKPRALVLESLQEEVHDTGFTSVEAGVKLSEYRIVRVVDHSGAVHVIRKNTKTQFECSRQGYFSHPLGCNKFYRCVKFDQYSDEFTVFEYDCPTGLAFDERWEVCVWPGSLPHGAPCTGSSEIAPVPRSHYECPSQEGYYADPENCRWFFACLDHARDGITPLTAYEFRCPFGLVFSQQKLACDWPWLVGSCGNRGAAGYFNVHSGGQSQVIHSATFINGGNLEASFSQYDNTDQEAPFNGFGKKFGSILEETNTQSSHQGAQSAGFGYIANRFDDHNNRASFATFPDYEISGGRIFNTGGVVLDQNIAVISNAASSGVLEGLGGVNIREGTAGASRSSDKNAAHFHQENVKSIGGVQRTNFEKLEPGLETSKNNILSVSGGQISLKNSIPTPRPFSVSIPSVQINSEKISEHSEHSTVGSTAPQTLIFKEIPSTENVNIELKERKLNEKQHSNSYSFSSSQPSVSVEIPAVTPTTETLVLGGAVSEGYDSSHLKADISLNIPSISISSTPRIKTYKVHQSSLKQNTFPSRFSINQAPVTVGVPVATKKQSFEYNAGSSEDKIINEAISTFVPLVTPKPVVPTFDYTAKDQSSGSTPSFGSRENSFVSISQQNQKITGQNSVVLDNSRQNVIGQSGISYEVPLVTAVPPISISGSQTESKSEEHLSVVSPGSKPIGFVPSTIDEKVSSELRFNTPQNYFSVPTVTPKSEFFTFSNVVSNEYSGHLNADSHVISNKIPTVTPQSDFKIFSKTRLNLKDVTDKSETISAVTPQPNDNLFKYYGSQADVASVTPIIPFYSSGLTSVVKNSFEQSGIEEVPKVSYNAPVAIPQSNVKKFEQINSFLEKGISQEEKASYSIPGISSGIRTDTIFQTVGVSPSFIEPISDIKFPQVVAPVRPVFGQRYSYSSSFKQSRNQFGSKQPFETVSSTPKPKSEIFVTKIEQPNTLTAVTIEQQPIVSVGTISSTDIEQTLSTPKPFSLSQDVLPQNPAVEIFNFKSNYDQPSLGAITTPATAVSATLSTPINFENQQPTLFLDANVKPKYPLPTAFKKQDKFNLENFTPEIQQTVFKVPGNIITGQKSLDLKQEIKPFAPNSLVTASIPTTFTKKITAGIDADSLFYSKSSAYLPPVTSKSEVYRLVQQKSQLPTVQFETTEKNQILIQEQPVSVADQHFIKTKPLTEEGRVEYIQQVPVVSGHQNQVEVSTSKPFRPREEFLGFGISKSVEINTSQSYQSTDGHLRQNLPVKELEIQQQPLHLISEKTFPGKQVIQPFYTQKEKETVQSIINNIPENIYEKQFVYQHKINAETPKTEILKQKQYLPPAIISKPQVPLVSYSVAKTVNVERPTVYSEGSVRAVPALPVFESSKIPLTEQKETVVIKTKTNGFLPPSGFVKSSDKAIFSEQFVSRQPQEVSSNVNLLLPTSTVVPQHTLSETEELSVQTHRNFDSQKISTPLGQNVLIQPEIYSTLKPVVRAFETSGGLFQYDREQNFTEDGHSAFTPGIKYAINPNIAIPEPPKEYILAQNEHRTTAPLLSTTLGQFSSKPTEPVGSRFKGSTYLSPQISYQKKPIKTTIISAGDLNEKEFPSGNVQRFFDKFSGKFGELVNGENENIVTKVIKGDGEGEIVINKEGSSTVQYEVSTATPRQNIRGRQYHGGITSGISKATNKYEEYEINGGKSGQRSFENEKDGQDNTDKATIDLKNVKLDKDKKTVIVVSQVSDANPVLIGKLAGQCSCQSNMLELRSKNKKSKNGLRRKNSQNQQLQSTISNEYLPPYENNQASLLLETQTVAPDTIVIGGSKALKQDISFTTEQSLVSSSTAAPSNFVSSTILSSLGPDGVLSITPKAVYAKERTGNKNKQFRGRARYLQPSSAIDPVLLDGGTSAPLLSPVPASEIASTFDYSTLKVDESRNQDEIDKGRGDGISEVAAGAAFDRYGPGGWRGFDETLQGSIDCKRPGLFRHPKYCNKFYACNYDPWKERYTLHVFNCPIHLTYDSSISACNWPVRGPACADDNLLV